MTIEQRNRIAHNAGSIDNVVVELSVLEKMIEESGLTTLTPLLSGVIAKLKNANESTYNILFENI